MSDLQTPVATPGLITCLLLCKGMLPRVASWVLEEHMEEDSSALLQTPRRTGFQHKDSAGGGLHRKATGMTNRRNNETWEAG